jgi:hypothetical protein
LRIPPIPDGYRVAVPMPVRKPTLTLMRTLATLLALLALAQMASAHPQDGPHCDLRLAVGERSVTWNIGMNLAFADELIGVQREAIDVLDPVEEPAFREALLEHLVSENRVAINGDARTPVVREWTIGRADLALLPLFPNTGRRALTRFVVALEYPAPEGVTTLDVTWRGYPEDVISTRMHPGRPPSPMAIEAFVQAQGRVDIVTFLESAPTVTWAAQEGDPADVLAPVPTVASMRDAGTRPPLAVLMIVGTCVAFLGLAALRTTRHRFASALCLVIGALTAVGAAGVALRLPERPPFTDDDADAVTRPLINNVYEAFTHTDESVIYDLLARSATGDVLDRLYRDVYRSMIVSDHDQGRAIISSVTPSDVTLIDGAPFPERFRAEARWDATGSIYHWGHSHDRTYTYTADMTIADVEGAWRITELTITDTQRTDDEGDAFPIELPEGFEL